MGHTLLLGSVGLDVYDVTDVVRSEAGRESDGSMLPVLLGKQVTGSSPETKGVRHLEDWTLLTLAVETIAAASRYSHLALSVAYATPRGRMGADRQLPSG